MKTIFVLASGALLLSGCGAVGRLQTIGKAPKMSPAETTANVAVEPSLGQAGATLRREARTPGMFGSGPGTAPGPVTASLFRAGAAAFLADQRATRIGDILTIRINIADKAEVGNNTTRDRTGSENASVGSLLGLQKLLPKSIDPTNLASTSSKSQSAGGGKISRSETVNMTMSAIVTDVLPNGNLTVRGRQEVRVNNELRELIVTGIVRPQDIARDNSVLHSQIAEARISYGGRGQLSDAQQARWGQQIYDALFPF
ncbi:flagellar basal body L-ring protein FlgH [Sphingomonas sp. TREG-RG-20F-R18-01]|uniref:flagellar basal body L-ring protein FlgH n=1 Tax=Sphingomonas sp. TREG-RG-20F-R18-01 TaxID=2914982 RepID=UPI001F58EF44|nr:flagellar basal body L-ring protein FlgH [Sphingomonas sp. TREG-RG-20F-R18-01]